MTRSDADDARRKIFGYELRQRSVPGMLDSFIHVDGELQKCRERLQEIECQLPRLKAEAARYANVKASLAPWPWIRINRERNAELDQQEVLHGRLPQRRGISGDMSGRTVLTTG